MNRPSRPAAQNLPDPTIRMSEGWHCLHLYYTVNQKELNQLDEATRSQGREDTTDHAATGSGR